MGIEYDHLEDEEEEFQQTSKLFPKNQAPQSKVFSEESWDRIEFENKWSIL